MTLGQYIFQFRVDHDMSIRAFARASGLSAPFISSIEKGVTKNGNKVKPSASTYKIIAATTGVSITELFEIVDDDIIYDVPLASHPQTNYERLSKSNKAFVDQMIDKLLASQADDQ